MPENQEEKNQKSLEEAFDEIDVGDEIIAWEAWDNPPQERGRLWYAIAGGVAIALIVYAVMSANFLFAIIVLMTAVIMIMNGLRPAHLQKIHLTSLGIVYGDEFYPYQEIKDFSIIYQPPEVQILYIDFHKLWRPLIAIPLGDVDPNDVRAALLPFVFENLNREDEHLTDAVKRMYKL
ncbi:MAG: hypothetical protein WC730_01650 [Patescibacteria group bacterium]|jgi:hypothetical protein